MAEPAGDLPAPEPPPEPPAEPAPRPAAEPVVEPNPVFFLSLPLCGTCAACFRMLVFCRRPSFHSFFFGVSVSLVFLPVFAGFVIWVVFTCHVSLGYACLSPFVPLFLVFSLVLSLQVLRTFLCS